MNVHDVILRPVVTEKSTVAREAQNAVTLAVDPRASKQDVKRAVEELFRVSVLRVRTLTPAAKKKRVGRFVGPRRQWKKAIVVLAAGQKIEFFEGV